MSEGHPPRSTIDRSKAGRLFDRVSRSRAVPGNQVTFQHDPATAYEAMLELIASARRWIHFDNYIIRDDRTGQRFAEALAARAREGIAVRVLTDWLGSFGTRRRYWQQLREAGVEVRIFGPPTLRLLANFSRNHRKLVVADGEVAVTGGICIGDEWVGDPARGQQPWRDSAVRIAGPAAAVLDQAFGRVWARCGAALPDAEQAAEVAEAGPAAVRVLEGEPGMARLGRLMTFNLATAAERVWITDAYLVAPRALAQEMSDAVRDGVDVRILVPGLSDLPVVRNLTRMGYRHLLTAGVRIYEWGGPMLHAKTSVTDGRWVRIGSTNLNWSSLLGNWELDVIVEHPEAASEMERAFRHDLAQSAEVLMRRVRGPQRLQRVLPAALAIGTPEQAPPPHRPGRRERRRRRLVAMAALAASARRTLLGSLAVLLLAVAVLSLLVPRVAGLVLGAMSFLVAAYAIHGALRLEQPPRPADQGP
jgi:cardiolipin synthase